MFDLDSKIRALAENYGIELLLEQNEISARLVIEFLVDENLLDLDDYFNLDAEMAEWKRVEE